MLMFRESIDYSEGQETVGFEDIMTYNLTLEELSEDIDYALSHDMGEEFPNSLEYAE